MDLMPVPKYMTSPENIPEADIHEDNPNRLVGFLKHVHDIGREASIDYQESKNKVAFLGKTALAGATQVAERAQFTVLAVPPLTLDALNATHSPLAAGAVAGGLTFAWNNLVGESLAQGLATIPKAVKEYGDRFSRSTEIVYDTLPANHAYDTKDGRPPSKARKMAQFLIYHGLNGATATLRGMTSYVATNSVLNHRSENKMNIRKFYQKAAVDGAIVTGMLTSSITEAVAQIGTTNPDLASRLQFYEGDKWVGYGILLLLGGVEYVRNRQRKHKQKTPELENEKQK